MVISILGSIFVGELSLKYTFLAFSFVCYVEHILVL
jgi:hypothetical protein